MHQNYRKIWFARWIKIFFFWFLIDVDESFYFRFPIHFDFYSFWFAIQVDLIHFNSVWFWFVANHDSPTNKIKSNQKSKVGESWLTHFRVIIWFDFESKANQTKSRIKLVRALLAIMSDKNFIKNEIYPKILILKISN